MGLPTEPVTLAVAQIEELQQKLANLRHDINNHLSLIVAAAELIKVNPDLAKRMCATMGEQPPKIADAMTQFAAEMERILRITRD